MSDEVQELVAETAEELQQYAELQRLIAEYSQAQRAYKDAEEIKADASKAIYTILRELGLDKTKVQGVSLAIVTIDREKLNEEKLISTLSPLIGLDKAAELLHNAREVNRGKPFVKVTPPRVW